MVGRPDSLTVQLAGWADLDRLLAVQLTGWPPLNSDEKTGSVDLEDHSDVEENCVAEIAQ